MTPEQPCNPSTCCNWEHAHSINDDPIPAKPTSTRDIHFQAGYRAGLEAAKVECIRRKEIAAIDTGIPYETRRDHASKRVMLSLIIEWLDAQLKEGKG